MPKMKISDQDSTPDTTNYDLEVSNGGSVRNFNGTHSEVYLVPLDPNIHHLSYESNVEIPLLNSMTSDHSQGQYYLSLQTLQEERQGLEVLIDDHQENGVKEINEHYNSNGKEMSDFCISSQEISETSSRNTVAPKLMKKQVIKNYIHIPDRSVLPRAFAVLPSVLQLRNKSVIAPRQTLPAHTRFGPVIGIKNKSHREIDKLSMTASINKTPLFVLKEECDQIIHIDVSDKDKSNWIGLLPLGDEDSANVWLYEENNELYILSTEAIPSRKPLMLGYSKNYARTYGLIGPTKDIEAECSLEHKSWWCYECHRGLPSSAQLQRHMNAYHQGSKKIKRYRYRCRNCMLTFCRLFTLRRHIARHCRKKATNISENVVSNSETIPDSSLNSISNLEDKLPSDESFQNFTNGLDFSTNLFDTDRMPSLDVSGSSRSDVFNPYVLGENRLTNDLDYVNLELDKKDNSLSSDSEKKPDSVETALVQCPYCNESIAKDSRRRHVSDCKARRFECDCKKVFTSYDLLANHIYTQHSNERKAEERENEVTSLIENDTSNLQVTCSINNVDDPMPYKCEQCQHPFKRRGMLINHLWRKHDTVTARVPLERRVRHYPCVACPKLYRTANKRDRHIKLHHPDAERSTARTVEGGTRVCAPASCPECPRQYATRAKMLQHMRSHHPHVAALVTKTKTTRKDDAAEADVFF